MKTWLRLLGALPLLPLAVIARADDAPVLVYPCERAQPTPVLDGRLDDPAWRAAPLVGGFVYYDRPDPAPVPTEFRALYDDRALYVGVRCHEPEWRKLSSGHPGARDDFATVFRGETVEVFVDPRHDHSDYYQLAVDPDGTLYDCHRTDGSWQSATAVRCAVSEGQWCVEMAIPWAELGVRSPRAGMVVGLNVCRDRNLTDRQWTTWAHVAANFHDPAHFGHLVLSPGPDTITQRINELRAGGMTGPVRVFGPEGFTGTTYLQLAAEQLRQVEALLAQLDSLRARERSPLVAQSIEKRLAAARTAVGPVVAQVKAGRALDASGWWRAQDALARVRAQLKTAVWDSRLEALLNGI